MLEGRAGSLVQQLQGEVMSKIFIAFEVDQIALFDALARLNGDTTAIGERVIGAMMTGTAGFSDRVGMAAYGVEFRAVSPATREGD